MPLETSVRVTFALRSLRAHVCCERQGARTNAFLKHRRARAAILPVHCAVDENKLFTATSYGPKSVPLACFATIRSFMHRCFSHDRTSTFTYRDT